MAFIDKTNLKTELGITDTNNDTLLTALATAILSLWDELTNRIWAEATYTEYHSTCKGDKKILLDNYPIGSITSLYDDDDWVYGSDTLIDTDDYTFHSESGIVYYCSQFSEAQNNIKIVYVAGYTDANVPNWLKQVLVRQGCHWFKQAKDQRWDMSSKVEPAGGGTISYKGLEDNLLPDFVMLAEKNSR